MKLLIEGNEFIGDPPAPAKTWGEYFENVVTTSRLSGLRVSALAEDAMQRLTDVQQEMNCYGDGNVYRGQRSKDSTTQTITFSESKAVEPVAFIHKDFARRIREVLTPEDFLGDKSAFLKYCMSDGNLLPLYSAPPKREPLTDKDVERLVYENTKINPNVADDRELLDYIVNAVRAVERAHGIRGEE